MVQDESFIHLEVFCKPTQGKFMVTVVYAPNEFADRIDLWDRFKTLQGSVQGPWLMLGDFNNVLNTEERVRGLQPSYLVIFSF